MRNRYFSVIIVGLVLFLGSCASARKQFENGNYDRALEISVQKLRKNPSDQKHIDILLNAYQIANELDMTQINRLKTGNTEGNWEEIYRLYRRLDHRQALIRQLPKLQPSNPTTDVDFVYVDYNEELHNSRTKAVEALYNQGMTWLQKGDRFSCRTAYDYFSRASAYDSRYQDVQQKMEQARLGGITHVLYAMNKQVQQPLPPDFENSLASLDLSGFNRQWLQIDRVQQGNINYHYFIEAVIVDVIMGPERLNQTTYIDKATIEDGWEYAKNPDGSVRTDSLGNKIKVPIYREVTAKVTKTEQTKECTVNGMVLIYANGSSQRIAQDPIHGSARFFYEYATAQGDSRAMSKTTAELVKRFPKPFPPFADMVMLTSGPFNQAVYDKIRQYKSSLD